MLALVKKPHIELSLSGENVDELIDWIRKKYEVSTPVTEAISKGITDDNVRSIMITSMAKTTAAIGDLKIAEIAAALASPSSKVICL